MFTSTDHDKLQQLMASSPENRALIEKLLASHEEAVASISHEIRNPLTLVYSTLQLLESRHPDIVSDRYWLSMREDVEYMQQLLTELSSLNHSRSLFLTEFSFRSFMEQVVLSFAASCAESPVEFTSRLDPALPAFKGDRVKLREVFLNLLRNAREAIADEGSIRLETACSSSTITVSVRDTGCGIAREQLEHIFEPFVTFKQGGTGLGLAIAERTVRAHGGSISVTSAENAGTEFLVSLPV